MFKKKKKFWDIRIGFMHLSQFSKYSKRKNNCHSHFETFPKIGTRPGLLAALEYLTLINPKNKSLFDMDLLKNCCFDFNSEKPLNYQ